MIIYYIYTCNCTGKASKTNQVKVEISLTDVSKDLTIPKIVLLNEAIAIHPQRLRGNTSMGYYR